MVKVKSFKVGNLPKDNHLAYNKMVLVYAKENELICTQLGVFVEAYSKAVAHEQRSMLHELDDYTPKIGETDERRDNIYRAFRRFVKGYLRYPDARYNDAAEKILHVMRQAKVKPEAQYDRETVEIRFLVEELQENHVAELEVLHLTEMVAALKVENDKMYNLLLERDIWMSERPPYAVRNAIRRTDRVYHALIDAVNAYAFIDTAHDYSPFIDAVNQTIKRLTLEVFKITKSGRKVGESEEEVEDVETVEVVED